MLGKMVGRATEVNRYCRPYVAVLEYPICCIVIDGDV
jgi:hypothetical protein